MLRKAPDDVISYKYHGIMVSVNSAVAAIVIFILYSIYIYDYILLYYIVTYNI